VGRPNPSPHNYEEKMTNHEEGIQKILKRLCVGRCLIGGKVNWKAAKTTSVSYAAQLLKQMIYDRKDRWGGASFGVGMDCPSLYVKYSQKGDKITFTHYPNLL